MGGELIAKYDSSINGEIFIFEDCFGKWMRIGGVSQSGGLVTGIWKKAIREVLKYKDIKISNVLILGLGCGDAAKIVVKRWPEAKIVGVEIDPIVVGIGKKYFGVGEIANLEVMVGDAVTKVKRQKLNVKSECQMLKFDLILVDLYLGKEFPKEAESDEFLYGLKEILSSDGIAIFNRFYWNKYKKQATDFKDKLEKIFPKVMVKKTYSNLLLFASNLGSIEV